jgi:glycosyltransferase involved in cell wall biosynthesis
LWASLRLIVSALAMRVDVAIICNGSGYWFPLAVLPFFGMKVIPTLHNVLWSKNRPPKGAGWLIHRLDALFFGRAVISSLCVSHEIARQVEELTKGRLRPVVFLPIYRSDTFVNSGLPPTPRQPFRVLYAGRIERDKGVVDLLEVARNFAAAGRTDIEFDLCGGGSYLSELQDRTAESGLSARFRCHGHCNKRVMQEMFARAHVVIAPTTKDFNEGFCKVIAEGVLGGRPVIASDACPALESLHDAVVAVAAGDIKGYSLAIESLCDNEALFQEKLQGCTRAAPQFYDKHRGWGTILKNLLSSIRIPAQPSADRADFQT